MTDYINSIKAILYDRAISPLFGIFAFSWIGWNYKFLLVLFSSMEIEGKISYIQYVLYSDEFQRYGIGLFFPVLTTAIAIYGYPFISIPVYKEVRKRQKELREIKQSYSDLQLLDEKESRALIRQGLDQEREFDIALKSRDEEIARFRLLNTELANEIATLKENSTSSFTLKTTQTEEKPEIIQELTASQKKMMSNIGTWPKAGDLDLFDVDGLGKIHAEHDLDVLLERNFVAPKGRGTLKDGVRRGNLYALTPSGREYILQEK